MSTSLLAFLSLLEKRVLPVLPADKTWRFQRLVDFRARGAVLQLWEEANGPAGGVLSGQVELRESPHEDSGPSFNGSVQSATGGGNRQKFSFHPNSEEDVERQVELVADLWRRSLGTES